MVKENLLLVMNNSQCFKGLRYLYFHSVLLYTSIPGHFRSKYYKFYFLSMIFDVCDELRD